MRSGRDLELSASDLKARARRSWSSGLFHCSSTSGRRSSISASSNEVSVLWSRRMRQVAAAISYTRSDFGRSFGVELQAVFFAEFVIGLVGLVPKHEHG